MMGQLHVFEYGLDEVKQLIHAELNNPDVDWTDRQSNEEVDEEFHAGFTLKDAANALIFGWDGGREALSEEVENLIEQLREEVNDYLGTHHREVRDVAGGFVDMDRFMVGEPECMVESWLDVDAIQGKAIKVLVNSTVSWIVDSERLIKRGAAILAAVDAVLASGMNVELWMGESIRPSGHFGGGGNDYLCELVCLKEFNDVLDPDVMAFTVAHPAMLRRILFFLNERHPKQMRSKWGFGPESTGYGRPSNWPDEITETFDLVIERYENGDEIDPKQLFEKMMRMGDRASEYV